MGDFIVILFLAMLVILVIYKMKTDNKKEIGCGGCSGNCANCHKTVKNTLNEDYTDRV